MPTYRNNSKYSKNIGGETLNSNKEVSLLTYHNLKGMDGVNIINPFPYYSPVIISEKIEENKIINIPKFDFMGNFIDKFILHFYIQKGEIIINFNVPENRMPLRLYEGAKWNIRCNQRLIDRIFIKSENIFICWLISEKIL